MSYRIKFGYDTGDSFNQYPDQQDVVELEFNNIDVAKANIDRIEEHWKFNQQLESYFVKNKEELIEEASKKDWFTKDHGGYNCIIIYTDDNKPYKFWPQWMGYFETLNWVELEKVNNDKYRKEL